MQPAVLEARQVSKRFGGTAALRSVSIRIAPGTIHALAGENGAGKSTLVSVLSGNLRPDSGVVLLNGQPLRLNSAADGEDEGISVVHQHFALIPAFTVAESLAFAALRRGPFWLDADALASNALRFADKLKWNVTPSAKVADLSVGEKQRIEILRALATSPRFVLFDEPTATLTAGEADQLFQVMRSLASEGVGVLFITHRLREALSVADRVTVLRKGSIVLSETPSSQLDESSLARAMVGDFKSAARRRHNVAGSHQVLAQDVVVQDSEGRNLVDGANLAAPFGAITGIAGVDGNGQTEFAEALAGVRGIVSGSITIPDGAEAAYIPQDRAVDGLALDMSVQDNLMIRGQRKPSLVRFGLISSRRKREWCSTLIQEYDVRAASISQIAGSLSGGNQQKLILARELDSNPLVIVAADPTRGLDVRAANFVRQKLVECAADGRCVILFSSDLDELSEIADKVYVMSRGRILEGDVASLMGGTV
jgi:simple sugar transport system ATP-binding protein